MKAKDSPSPSRASGDMRQLLEGRKDNRRGPAFSDVLKSLSERESKKRDLVDILGPNTPQSAVQALPELSFQGEPSVQETLPSAIDTKKLISLLVSEIRTEVPSSEHSAVDIEFNSKILNGLHVRITKSSHELNIAFSTASSSISKLLSDNSATLLNALVQRGYVEPTVSVQETAGPPAQPYQGSRRGRGNPKRDQGHQRNGQG
jgi:hypothetical protein